MLNHAGWPDIVHAKFDLWFATVIINISYFPNFKKNINIS